MTRILPVDSDGAVLGARATRRLARVRRARALGPARNGPARSVPDSRVVFRSRRALRSAADTRLSLSPCSGRRRAHRRWRAAWPPRGAAERHPSRA